MREWLPNKRQADFLALPDSIFEALYGGAAGGGKSEVLLMLPIVRKFHLHPQFKGLLLRRTYPELEKEIILRSQDYYPHFGGKFNGDHKRWQFPHNDHDRYGGVIQFGHIEHEKDVRKYDTSEYNYIAFDEATSFTPFQYTYLSFSRCRSKSLDLPAIVRGATNPGNISHRFFRERFVEPNAGGYKLLVERRNVDGKEIALKRIFIPAKATDNTVLMENDPGYMDRMVGLSEAERRAKRDGDWWTFEGQVFGEWRHVHFVGEPENAIHVIDPFPIPEWWPKILAIDWGFTAKTVALWFTISPQGRIYVYRERWWQRTNIAQWAKVIGDIVQNERIVDTVMCRSAFAHRGDERTIAEQFHDHSGLTPRPADNDRVGGKQLIHEMLRWTPRPIREARQGVDHELALKIWRMNGSKAYQQYLDSFAPEPEETNLPKVQVFRDCTEVTTAVPTCVYDDTNKEDVKEFEGDDAYDTFRYGLKAVEQYQMQCVREELERAKVGEIIADLEKTGNQTAFYQRMERLESKQRKVGGFKRHYVGKNPSSYLTHVGR